MKTLISKTPIDFTHPQFRFPTFHFHSLPYHKKSTSFLSLTHRKCFRNCKTSRFFHSSGAFIHSRSASYGGWDDLSDSGRSGELDQFRSFLVSVGINDRKHVIVFVLGFACALAIYRVRVSSIILFPASVLVFAVGFVFGGFQRDGFSELSVGGNKSRGGEEILKGFNEKLKVLMEFLEGFDAKVNKLKYNIQKAVDSREISLNDLENYVKVLGSNSVSTLNCRKVIKSLIDSPGSYNALMVENQKPTRKKKELGEIGYELFQFFGSLFGENLIGSVPTKMKNNVKRENGESGVSFQNERNGITPAVKENTTAVTDSKRNVNLGISEDFSSKSVLVRDRKTGTNIDRENGKINSDKMHRRAKKFIDREEYSYQNNRLRLVENHCISSKMVNNNEPETWLSGDNLLDSVNFGMRMKHTETEASFLQERVLKKSSRAYRFPENEERSENEIHGSKFREESLNHNDDSHFGDQFFGRESEVESSTSSAVYDDIVFDRYLTEANDLLKQVKESMRGKHDEARAEIILYRSAKLLSKATALRPMSLLAVGLLGNTYLLHGELKLRISRELRRLLLLNEPLSDGKWSGVLKGLNDQIGSKDDIASLLINVCEECEELLMEAGRKYRLALSIDGNDVRALYNWGLALSFRAQLIADIGPDAAFDADKVFLAAIDKFDAMISRGNVYAPDALFRWAVTLQQRSRLRGSNNKEKAKLLHQAKSLYEDALSMDSGNLQVREALMSCISELNFRDY